MRRTVLLSTLVAAVLLACAGVVVAQPDSTTPKNSEKTAPDSEEKSSDGVIPGKFIVELKDDVDDPKGVAAEHSRRFGARVNHVYEHALNGYAAELSERGLSEVRADTRVSRVSPDREVKALQDSSDQKLPFGVDRAEGEASSTKAGDGVGSVDNVQVAVIDTGIDLDHADLNVQDGKTCISGTTTGDDDNGHGTHVAGTIGAKDDATGVVGVAPGVKQYAVKVLDSGGSGSWSSVVCGIDWVTGTLKDSDTSNDIKVANMSLGGSGKDGTCGSSALHKAICNSTNAGVTHVVAAGNSNTNFSSKVPATYAQVLTVGAMADFNGQPGGGAEKTCRSDEDDTNANFSNYTKPGSADDKHLIAAPGVCIESTWMGGGYKTISGTSMATPHVAGAAALCIATSATNGGKCTGGPSDVRSDLLSDAGAQPKAYGFTHSTSKSYGKLLYLKGY